MKALSKFNITIFLSVCIVLTACDSGSGNQPTPPTYQKTTLYTFAGGIDGARPFAGLIQAMDGNFYGTTSSGGSNNAGTVFKVTPQEQETVLYSFVGATTDGAEPQAGLIQATDGNFYGTTYVGGATNLGTVYIITPQGVESSLYSFTGVIDGAYPQAGLIQAMDGNLYGTTQNGGVNNYGTIFKITPQGQETVLYSLKGYPDGINPVAGLIQALDGNFYGTTAGGGFGTVFKITPQGQETVLYSFIGAGKDGANSQAGLIQAMDGNFYGTTSSGGLNRYYVGYGTVFKITPQGQETVLYAFAGKDGANPQAGLIQAMDGNFYGTTKNGVVNDYGTVFKITPQGQETVVYSFTGGTDGAYPQAGLIQAMDGNFYGTTYGGGSNNNGTVFKISIK